MGAHIWSLSKCRVESRCLFVDAAGNVQWGSQTRQIFRVPLAGYNVDKLREQFYTEKDSSEKCTVGCTRTNSNLDNWTHQ